MIVSAATPSTSTTTGAIRGASLGVTGAVNAHTVSASELTLSSIHPGIWFSENDAPTNKKLWYLVVDGEMLQFQTRNDNSTYLGTPALAVSRAGTITTTDMIVSAATPSTSPTTGASRVTGGQGVQGNQYVGGFSSLGGDANHPGIKVKVLTGTTAATQGGFVGIAHGVTDSKIISVDALVEYSPSSYVANAYSCSAGYCFDISTSSGSIHIGNHPTNSAGILSKPVEIIVIYTE
jgi:hypothetical protein